MLLKPWEIVPLKITWETSIEIETLGKVWYDSLFEWGETRYAVAETFAMKQVVTMMEDAWLTASGRADVEGLKLWMAKEKGRRDSGVAMA